MSDSIHEIVKSQKKFLKMYLILMNNKKNLSKLNKIIT